MIPLRLSNNIKDSRVANTPTGFPSAWEQPGPLMPIHQVRKGFILNETHTVYAMRNSNKYTRNCYKT